MKIYVVGSSRFAPEMVDARDELRALGYDGWIHPDYELISRGEKTNVSTLKTSAEKAHIKRSHDYYRAHYKNILQSDAILVVNLEKEGVPNYIGGNVLIEMGQAYVSDKMIFLLNDIPRDVPYVDEIEAMDPVCLQGKLEGIAEYVHANQVKV